MSAFFIQFSLVSVMLSRRAQRTQKALRTRGTHQKLIIFSDMCNQCKVGKRALPLDPSLGLFWFSQRQTTTYLKPGGGGGRGGTPIHYLHWYVPPNGVVILKLLIQNGVSISEAFSRTGYKNCGSRLHLLLKIVTDYEEAFI